MKRKRIKHRDLERACYMKYWELIYVDLRMQLDELQISRNIQENVQEGLFKRKFRK